ncbi:OFA family MFS transporter [Paraliobacillus sp. JSM ZJ581]|uniref:L-lactate MFS transporter n=1 Tax=Paraliobacillus sp. JSM ZJ581 TaxID=3342118 RepID=UPI0035A93F86
MENKKGIKNRWLIALAGVAIHLSIGSAYAWSVFTIPISDLTGWSTAQISFAFSLAIFFLGTSAAFMGHFVEKQGPKKSGMVAAILFGLGIACTGFAIKFESLPLLYITYGVIGGAGLGTGYVTPVSTMIKWFPDRRGLATGLAIMGFGFAALVTGPVAQQLINSIGVSNTFFVLGISYFVVMFLASLYLEKPPKDWKPKGFEGSEGSDESKAVIQKDLSQLTANQAVKTRRFWLMWFMLFINITCGIALVSVASPMAQEITGMTAVTAATMVGVMGFFNGGGRFFWATLSDYFGRPNTFTTFFVLNVIVLILLYFTKVPLLYMILIYIIMTCYGGGFAVIPAYIGDMFGTKELGAIHGYILTAWAMAGMAGPLILSFIYDLTGKYSGTLILFTILCLVALILSLVIRMDIKRLQQKQAQ